MFIQTLLCFLIVSSIFFLSSHLNSAIYQIAILLTRNKKFSFGVLILLLLPGTIIHELSHFIIATLLFVPSGNLTIFPKIEEGRVKAGSLHHANTDPIRRTLIGLAPMIVGLLLIYIAGQLLFQNLSNSLLLLFAIYYLLFVTSISMFSSQKDLEVAKFVVPIIFILLIALYINGVTVSFSTNLIQKIGKFLTQLNIYLLITLGLDLGIFLILKGILSVLQKLLKIKVTPIKS